MEPRASTPPPRSDPLGALRASVIVPVIREDGPDKAVETALWLAARGLEVAELTASTPDWPRAVEALRRERPDAVIGVGTVRDPAAAEQAVTLGADFLVTPHPAPGVREVAGEVPLIEGGFTPGEVLAAADLGVAKLFPAHVGGPSYLRSILALAPGARVIPTGGIGLADVPAWLDAGAYAVGLGGELRPSPEVEQALQTALTRLRSDRAG